MRPRTRHLASGDGWSVSDVICTAGPQDRPFEEQHSRTSIAIVVSGTFQYRSAAGRELMTPGSLLLGNAGDCFCCGHEHGTGDRCLAVSYTPECFERLSGSRWRRAAFWGRTAPADPCSSSDGGEGFGAPRRCWKRGVRGIGHPTGGCRDTNRTACHAGARRRKTKFPGSRYQGCADDRQ